MLASLVQEFVVLLAGESSELSLCDSCFLTELNSRFTPLAPDCILGSDDLHVLTEMFKARWHMVADTREDYTFDSQGVNKHWTDFAKHLASELDKPWVRVIIPVLSHDVETDTFTKLNQISDPREIWVDEQGGWHLVSALLERLKKNPWDLAVYNELGKRSLTLNELFRIRSKVPYSTEIFDGFCSFWGYLTNKIVATWTTKGRLDSRILQLLLDIVELRHSHANDEDFESKLAQSTAIFSNYLLNCRPETQAKFYSLAVQFGESQTFILDLLLGCLHKDQELQSRLNALAGAVYRADLALTQKNMKHPVLSGHSEMIQYFDIVHLKNLFHYLPFKTLSMFTIKLELLEQRFLETGYVNKKCLELMLEIVSSSWEEIVDPQDELGIIAAREYKSFWQYLVYRFAPAWQSRGKLPTNLLADLLVLIDNYYETAGRIDAMPKRVNAILDFLNHLGTCAVEDVNFLYGVLLEQDGHRFYLLELFIERFQRFSSQSDRIPLLAKWLASQDKSLVSRRPELDFVYESLRLGKYFDIVSLRRALASLPVKPGSPLAHSLSSLCRLAESSTSIDTALVEAIADLYTMRWRTIIDTPDDYTRLTGEIVNAPWINLAQSLAGAQLIGQNYYKLLIPTLSHDEDFVSRNAVTAYPLTEYILSGRNHELIFLPNCVKHYYSYRTFANCNSEQARLLNSKEKERVRHAQAKYFNYFEQSEKEQTNLGLSQTTVNELIKLVNESIYDEGLRGELPESEVKSAKAAYKRFFKYMNHLPAAEKDDLLQHPIQIDRFIYTFNEIVEEIFFRWGCMATFGKYFVALIIDYKPDAVFSPVIEEKVVDRENMRLSSRRRPFREYSSLAQEEARRRILTLVVSLMTHSFKSFGGGKQISVLSHSNTVTTSGLELYKALNPVICSDFCGNENRILSDLIETVVKPAVLNKSRTRNADTHAWLLSIQNGTMFNESNRSCFEPDLLLVTMCSLIPQIKKTRGMVIQFTRSLIQMMERETNLNVIWIKANIEFHHYLNCLEPRHRNTLLTKMRASTQPVTKTQVMKAVMAFLEERADDGCYASFFQSRNVASSSSSSDVVHREWEVESFQSVSELLNAIQMKNKEDTSARLPRLKYSGRSDPVFSMVASSRI